MNTSIRSDKEGMLAIPDKKKIRSLARNLRREIPTCERQAMDEAIYNNLIAVLKALEMPEIIYTYVSTPEEADTWRLINKCINSVNCSKVLIPDAISAPDNTSAPYTVSDHTIVPSCSPKVAVPKVSGQRMDFFYINKLDDLESGYMGIYEPRDYCMKADANAENTGGTNRVAVIIPGLAFTKDGKRCGYGGGYYDRFLSENQCFIKIALCYSLQIFDDFETDEHDIKPDYIVTDKNVYYQLF